MTKKKVRQEESEPTKPFSNLVSKVEGEVMEKLGVPPNFSRCIAVPLFDNRFRVNVWETNAITDSFFVHATDDGIISSSPEITQKYAAKKKKKAPPVKDDEIVVAE